MGIVAVLSGPTASGKTALALRWAEARGYEILSADSRQIYRGFSIGTGAPSEEETRRVPHHLIGTADPGVLHSQKIFREEVNIVLQKNPDRKFLVVGGTGLYLKELLFPGPMDRGPTPEPVRLRAQEEIASLGLAKAYADLVRRDPEGMRGVHANDAYRIHKRWENWLITGRSFVELRSLPEREAALRGIPFFWLDPDRTLLHRAIEARVHSMLAQDWVEEVRGLMAKYDPNTTPAFNAVGYREMAQVISGSLSLAAATEQIVRATKQYAKRQTTFFRHQIPGAIGMDPSKFPSALEAKGWDLQDLKMQGLEIAPMVSAPIDRDPPGA